MPPVPLPAPRPGAGRGARPESATQAPALMMRGTVEGFYGPPWSPAQRLAHLEFSARFGLDTYVYAPKNDPYHRVRWREPYPDRLLDQIAELARTARRLDIRFTYAISPGLSMRFTEDDDHRALAAKASQLWDAEVRSFALFFDDVPAELTQPQELARYPQAGAAGAAHGETCRWFVDRFLAPRGVREPLLVCPVDYAGTDESPYRRQLARTAPPETLVAWTGRDIVVGEVTRDDIDRAAASYRRRIVLWDNFPVNDFDPARLFLGPLTGRTTALDGCPLAGILANPMVQAAPSQLPLATVADWARDPHRYHPQTAARRALTALAASGAHCLAPLVRVCSAWPPSADPDPELTGAAAGALAGVPGALDLLARRLDELAQGCRAAVEPQPLVAALRPWLDAGTATAEAGLAAVRLLRAATTDPAERLQPLREQVRAALDRAESHYANVLRTVVPPFVRDVLDRTAPAGPGHLDYREIALVVTGRHPTSGDHAMSALFERRKYAVRRLATPGPDDLAAASVVVVTANAAPAAVVAVARAGVPLLAWHGLVPLGLARGSDVVTLQDRVCLVDPPDAAPGAAGGTDGEVIVYRGPGKLTAAEVAPAARVVARTVGDARPVLFHYPAGSLLADRTYAPAPRAGLFLGPDGYAPWLLTDAGRVLVESTMDELLGRSPDPATNSFSAGG